MIVTPFAQVSNMVYCWFFLTVSKIYCRLLLHLKGRSKMLLNEHRDLPILIKITHLFINSAVILKYDRC